MAIDRQYLRRALHLPDKIPAEHCGTYHGIMAYDRWKKQTIGPFTVKVYASKGKGPGFRKTSFHRVFVVCPRCGREIPAGRYHMHEWTGGCK